MGVLDSAYSAMQPGNPPTNPPGEGGGGARAVSVEVTAGGLETIRVSDDGCGLAAGELEVAFARHATSKLSDPSTHSTSSGQAGPPPGGGCSARGRGPPWRGPFAHNTPGL